MIEYAIFTVMVIVTIGFAWLWLIEQQKKRREHFGKRRLSDDEVRAAHRAGGGAAWNTDESRWSVDRAGRR
jgi:hypothetical protein